MSNKRYVLLICTVLTIALIALAIAIYPVGETARGVYFKVDGVSSLSEIKGQTADGSYTIVTFSVENNKDDDILFNASQFYVTYSELRGEETITVRKDISILTNEIEHGIKTETKLGAGQRTTLKMVFELPGKHTEGEYYLHVGRYFLKETEIEFNGGGVLRLR